MLRRAFLSLFAAVVLLVPAAAKASPALVFEPYNGTVFYAEDPDVLWFPASLTKMMTAYVAFHALRNGEMKPDTPAIVTKKALQQPPTKLGLPVGTSIPLETAIRVIIVKSANDVAMMVAETVGGSEEAFVARMNEAAKRLGMAAQRGAVYDRAGPCAARPRAHHRVPRICGHLRDEDRQRRHAGAPHA